MALLSFLRLIYWQSIGHPLPASPPPQVALKTIRPKVESRLRYLDHIESRGVDLARAACERDLECPTNRQAS